MKKINEIIKELNLKWNEPLYLVVDSKKDKAVITNLCGLVWIASKHGIDTKNIETSDIEIIEHDLKIELESISIYVEYLIWGDDITYSGIEIVKTLNEFLN